MIECSFNQKSSINGKMLVYSNKIAFVNISEKGGSNKDNVLIIVPMEDIESIIKKKLFLTDNSLLLKTVNGDICFNGINLRD